MGIHFKENEEKITLGMIITGTAIIGILVSVLIIYLINAKAANTEEIAKSSKIVTEEENDGNFEEVSIDIGKSVNESENELTNIIQNENTTKNEVKSTTNTSKKLNTSANMTNDNTEIKNKDNENLETNEVSAEENIIEEVKLVAPLKGEIIREFAPDSLVYSETLEEWVTHNGIDIKADKTSVVKSAAKGKVFAIKNDPRYGLTVIVNHDGGYQTVYANLLTAEYVVEGEEIEEGQTIGTVGNSATFEIADDYHLHFEVLKNNEYIDPTNFCN